MGNSQNLNPQDDTPKDREDLLLSLSELENLIQLHNERISNLEGITEKRQRPKDSVVNTHKSFVAKVYGNRCPCCMEVSEDPHIDHFNSRMWGSIHDTWLICGDCNRALYHGRLSRAEILPMYVSYQTHMKKFIGGEQMSFLEEPQILFYGSELKHKAQ